MRAIALGNVVLIVDVHEDKVLFSHEFFTVENAVHYVEHFNKELNKTFADELGYTS